MCHVTKSHDHLMELAENRKCTSVLSTKSTSLQVCSCVKGGFHGFHGTCLDPQVQWIPKYSSQIIKARFTAVVCLGICVPFLVVLVPEYMY